MIDRLGEAGWLKTLRLAGYTSRRPRRPQALQQALFPYHTWVGAEPLSSGPSPLSIRVPAIHLVREGDRNLSPRTWPPGRWWAGPSLERADMSEEITLESRVRIDSLVRQIAKRDYPPVFVVEESSQQAKFMWSLEGFKLSDQRWIDLARERGILVLGGLDVI